MYQAAMSRTGVLISLAVAVVAWSQYRCYLLQERLSYCSENQEVSSQTGPPCPDAPPPPGEAAGPRSGSPTPGRVSLEEGSSVWCKGAGNADRTCRFHNLCFSGRRQEFVFLSGPRSVSSGLPREPFSPALVDLSSVADHNTQYFGFSHLPTDALASSFGSVRLLPGKHLLMNRFNPDNLMHVFHDDLLPAFATLLETGLAGKLDLSTDARLVFLDPHPAGEHLGLYASLISSGWPMLRADLVVESDPDGLVCFEEALVGLSNATVWYQYGFTTPQGPLPDSLLTANQVRLFTGHLRASLGTVECEAPGGALLLTRQSTRLILNEMELAVRVAESTGMRVGRAGLEDHTVEELIQLVSCAKVLIGMHGSLLVLSMFLPPGSLLVELYPYGINPDHYTPYRTLVQLPGFGLTYRAWRNADRARTVTHPDAEPSRGGIAHLDLGEQRSIRSSAEVPRHLCCSDPEWLYRVYQDSVVDVPSVLELIADGLGDAATRATETEVPPGPTYPGRVDALSCSLTDSTLRASWEPPWNVEHWTNLGAKYELWVQEDGQDDYDAYVTPLTEVAVSVAPSRLHTHRVWVRCLLDDVRGPFQSAVCRE